MYPIEELKGAGLSKRLSVHSLGIIAKLSKNDGTLIDDFHFSGFVAEISGDWWILTAGHSIYEISRAVARGFRLNALLLVDSFAAQVSGNSLGYRSEVPIPANVALEDWIFEYSPDNPSGIDVAAVKVPGFTRIGLEQAGVAPLRFAQDYERFPGQGYEKLVLVGTPLKRIENWGRSTIMVLRHAPVEPLQPLDVDPALRGPNDRIYGIVDLTHQGQIDLETVVGMSGGALFGIWFSEDRLSYDYAAVAVQSGWHQKSRHVAGWPLEAIAKFAFEAGL